MKAIALGGGDRWVVQSGQARRGGVGSRCVGRQAMASAGLRGWGSCREQGRRASAGGRGGFRQQNAMGDDLGRAAQHARGGAQKVGSLSGTSRVGLGEKEEGRAMLLAGWAESKT